MSEQEDSFKSPKESKDDALNQKLLDLIQATVKKAVTDLAAPSCSGEPSQLKATQSSHALSEEESSFYGCPPTLSLHESHEDSDAAQKSSSPAPSPSKRKAKKRSKESGKKKSSYKKSKKEDSSHDSDSSSSSNDSSSSSNSDSESSSDSSSHGKSKSKKFTKLLTSSSKDGTIELAKKQRPCTLVKAALNGHFNAYHPLQVMNTASVKYTGVKGVPLSTPKEMDIGAPLDEYRKATDGILYNIEKGISAGLAALVPVANRMKRKGQFSSLAKHVHASLKVLAATSTYIQRKRYEAVHKSVGTDAGKEVTRAKKVRDKQGKEITIFLAPKRVAKKAFDKTKMFGGQLQYLVKSCEAEGKCTTRIAKKSGDKAKGTFAKKKFYRSPTTTYRTQSGYRHRFPARPTGSQNQFPRPNAPRPSNNQGKGQAFPRGGK